MKRRLSIRSKERVRELLNEVPLSKSQRERYLEGLDKMTEEEAKSIADRLERGLDRSPEVLEKVRRWLLERRGE